jgi:DNA-binding transcriptional regulator YhcF (GntR family)
VAGAIRRAIAEGEAGHGERIPQAKDLAAELGVNANTVLRALRALRDEGVIEMGRGRSFRVTGQPNRAVITMKLKELVDVARARLPSRRSDLHAAGVSRTPRATHPSTRRDIRGEEGLRAIRVDVALTPRARVDALRSLRDEKCPSAN